MTATRTRSIVLVFACLVSFAHAIAQTTPDPWYARQANPRNIDPPKTFTGGFAIQLPKDWQLAPGYKETIFSVVEKTRRWEAGAVISLQQIRLQAPLEFPLSDPARDATLGELKAREPSGRQFSATVKTGPIGQIILLQYVRPGVSGRDDHVTQYSIPVGTTMYQLMCIAPANGVEKYRPLFAHVAASFTPIKPTGS